MENLTGTMKIFIGVMMATSIGLQFLMNYISSKINYKLDKKHYIVSLLLNPLCTTMISLKYGWSIPIAIIISIIATILLSSAMIDWKYQELPDSFNLIVGILGVSILIILMVFYNIQFKAIIPNIITALSLFLGFLILAVVSGGQIGGGDVKLMGAVGFLFHYTQIPQVLVYSFFPGALFAVILLLLKKKDKKDKFAFGPFLIVGAILTLLI